MLATIQHGFIEALANEKQDVPEHIGHPYFQHKLTTSIPTLPNAHAFGDHDHSLSA